jgi:cellulose synthase/poly-beta-1,6-N-acetylglucosamine synthase-like glycosyltransferase
MQTIFWISLFIIFYTYVGYGIVLFLIVRILRLFRKKKEFDPNYNLPSVTIVVAAYNEEYCIEEKITNTLSLEYPKDNVQYIFITDGSSDNTPGIISQYASIHLMHQPERTGKIVAVHRAMQEVKTEVVISTCSQPGYLSAEHAVNDMQIAEDLQLIVGHMVMQYLYNHKDEI